MDAAVDRSKCTGHWSDSAQTVMPWVGREVCFVEFHLFSTNKQLNDMFSCVASNSCPWRRQHVKRTTLCEIICYKFTSFLEQPAACWMVHHNYWSRYNINIWREGSCLWAHCRQCKPLLKTRLIRTRQAGWLVRVQQHFHHQQLPDTMEICNAPEPQSNVNTDRQTDGQTDGQSSICCGVCFQRTSHSIIVALHVQSSEYANHYNSMSVIHYTVPRC